MSQESERIEQIFASAYPRIEVRNGITLLFHAANVMMPIPSPHDPVGLGIFAWRLPPDALRDLFVALYRKHWPDLETADFHFILQLDQAANA